MSDVTDIVYIEVGKMGPAGSGITAPQYNTIRAEVDRLILAGTNKPYVNLRSATMTTTASTSPAGTPVTVIGDTNLTSGALPGTGTWYGLIRWGAWVTRTTATTGDGVNVIGRTNGAYLVTQFGNSIEVANQWTWIEGSEMVAFSAGTTPTFGLHIRPFGSSAVMKWSLATVSGELTLDI